MDGRLNGSREGGVGEVVGGGGGGACRSIGRRRQEAGEQF